MIAFFSVGLIFLSGVSYPLELMPWYWRAAHYIFPAAPGTLAFVKANSMGASVSDIRPEYITVDTERRLFPIGLPRIPPQHPQGRFHGTTTRYRFEIAII